MNLSNRGTEKCSKENRYDYLVPSVRSIKSSHQSINGPERKSFEEPPQVRPQRVVFLHKKELLCVMARLELE